MRKYFFLPLFFIIPISYLFAQEYEVYGNVKGLDGAAIGYANVLLLKISDSTFVKGTSADEKGFFKIDKVFPDVYLITASYIGNESEYRPLEVSSNTDVGSVIINNTAQVLDEVIVSSQKPTIEQKADRLVFTIENTTLSETDIWNALKNAPNVFIMNDEITIKGERGVGIMINEKMVNLPPEDIVNLLSGTDAGTVQAIEVITTPPAKYDAEGGSLINIIMKKNLISGYNGSVFNRYEQGVFPRHTLGTSHYFKGKKLEFSFNYSFNDRKRITRYTDIVNFLENNTITENWETNWNATRWDQRHNASLFFDYTLNDKNKISATSITSTTPSYRGFDDSVTEITELNSSVRSSFVTINNSTLDRINTSLYLDYVHLFDKKDTKLSFNTHYTYYDFDKQQDLMTDFFDDEGQLTSENDFVTTNEQRTDLYSVQVDFETPVSNSGQMETGLKYARIESESNLLQEGFNTDLSGIDPTREADFSYDESIVAAYASYASNWDRWNLSTGIRAEYTETTGLLSPDNTLITNDYLEFFPTFSLQFTPNKKHNFKASYYRRITRPRYSNLNPFQSFQSNNSVVEGNQNLLPSFKNQATISYTLNKAYTFEIYYRYHKDIQRQLTFQDNESRFLRFINANLDRELSYGLDFIVNKEIVKSWDIYVLSSYFYGAERFIDVGSGQRIDNGLWTLLLKINNNFAFLKDKSLSAGLNFTYVSPVIRGNSEQESYNELEISLRKTIWNKKGTISMGLSDAFKQFRLFNTRRFLDQDNTSLYRPEGRLFTLGFRYKFGNLRIRDNKKKKNVEERRRL
ncbi:MAG: outer membrane beta-barrel family protein [Saonia sp.]